jgi:hypothetical protein
MQIRRLARAIMAGFVLTSVVAVAQAGSKIPETYELTGFSGHIGEWELTATLARNGTTREFSGPLKMTHVGWCSQDGPEVKTGELHLKLALLSSGIDVKVRVDGVECAYQGRLTDVYTGTMSCPDRRPVPLTLWLR